MRLGSAGMFTASAARRLIRDLGEDVERLLRLIEGDAGALRPGVRRLDLEPIRARLEEVSRETPRERLESPLSGEEIMRIREIPAGPEVGRLKAALTEMVLDGSLIPGDKMGAEEALRML